VKKKPLDILQRILEVEEFEEEPEWRPEFLPEDQAIEVEPRASEKIKTEGPKMAFEESFDWLQESAMEVSPEPETLSQPAEPELAMEKTGDLFESIEDPLDDAEVFSFLDNLAASGVVDEADAIFEGTGLVEPSPVTDSAEEKLIEEHILPEELDESLDWLEQLAGEEPVEDFSPPIFVEGLDEEEEAEIPDWLEEVAERPVQAPSDRIDVDEVDVIEEFTEEPAPTAPSLSSIETIISKPIREEEIFPEEPAEEYPEEMFSEPSPSDASIEDKAEWLWTREAEEKPPIGEEVAAAISEPEIPEAEISEIEPEAEFEEVSAGTVESGDEIAHPIQEPAIDPHTAMLNAARYALEIGQIEEALGHYSDLIEEKVEMESVIQDLRIAIGKTPREPMLWQILGDALMKVGQLSDAIDAYRRGMEAV
jgi:tetratricopeptide (TPR) repeat protein